MLRFDAAQAAVHYPADRRIAVWIGPLVLAIALALVRLAYSLTAARESSGSSTS
jgi:hypothetical protein